MQKDSTDGAMLRRYTDQGYAEELTEIRGRLLVMAGRVEAMIEQSMRSLMERDGELARGTVELDHSVNQDEIDLDALCLQLLACRQPMASDLRFVTITMKMVTDLERIADLAVNVAERAADLSAQPELAPFIDIPKMGDCVRTMIRDSIDAFVEKDADKARRVLEMDDTVDDLYHKVFRHLLELMQGDSEVVERGIHIQSVAKFIERMGDHATNLAEQVIFMLGGEDVRHEGKLDAA